MWLTCARTVPGAMNSSWAISACDRPAAMSVRMFISRLLRFSNFSGEPSSGGTPGLFLTAVCQYVRKSISRNQNKATRNNTMISREAMVISAETGTFHA